MSSVSDALQELQRQFAIALPGKLEELRTQYQKASLSSWQPAGAQALHFQLHSLTGSAGTFGMQSLSVVTRQLENRVKDIVDSGVAPDEAAWAAIGAELARIEQLAQRRLSVTAPSLTLPQGTLRLNRTPLVHLVEDDPQQAEHLARALRDDGYEVKVYTVLDDYRKACTEVESPDAVVLDMMFPEGDSAGAELLAELGLVWEHCPPVVFVSVRDDLDARLAAYRAGASRYMLKPVAPEALIDLLDTLSGRIPPEPYRVLLVDDDPLLLEAQAVVLGAAGMTVQALSRPRETLDMLDAFRPDVVVLDVYMPEVSGPELAAIVRERDDYLSLPILFLSAETDMSQQLLALNLGGDDFLVKPVQPDHLVSAVTARARRARQNAVVQRRLQTTLYEREREHLALDFHALVSIADNEGNIIEVNSRFCEVSGYSRSELIGENHRIIKSGEHPPEFYAGIWSTILKGEVWRGEICNRRKNGSLYWVESTITPFLDGDGKPYQYVSIRTDITDVKAVETAQRAQNAMREVVGRGAALLLATKAATLDDTLECCLQLTGEHLGADRAYLFQLCDDGAHMSNTHGWWAPGITAHKDDLQRLPLDTYSWWWTQMQGGEMVNIPEVAALPAESAAEKALLESQGIRSLCAFPIRRAGDTVGFIAFDQVNAVRDWDAQALGLLGLMTNLMDSALVRAESELAAEIAKERLRRGQMYANIGTWEWNTLTGDLFWTERIAPLFGYPLGNLETSYDNFLGAVHPDDRQALTDAVDACIEHDVPYEIEHRVVWPDGTERWLLERGAVQRDGEGKAHNMIGVVQDVDDRKRAELALAEREQQLLEAQMLASIGNWTADLVSGELVWSDEIYRIFGYEPGSFTPSVAAFNAAVHPDDRVLLRQSESRAEETGRHDVIHRIVRPDGSIRQVRELAQMQLDDAGKPLRLTGTLQDVTERVAFEQALIAAREAADRANQAKSEFLSSMSHELRTPMNAILGFSQIMEYDETLPDEHKDSVQEILKAGRHLLNLIGEVLDLAKVESGKMDFSLEPVELWPVVKECLGLMETLAAKRNIRLGHKELTGIVVRADHTRLKQVLLNLLSNAIKYNREGGSVNIRVLTEGSDRLRILVSDTGKGIAPGRIAELFEPFNRLDAETSDIEGTGIGLTITRRIVEMMGGIVDVESEVGVGSTFWIELPLEALPDAMHTRETTGNTDKSTISLNTGIEHTVLYIEDNPSNIKLVAQLLGRIPEIHLLTAHTPTLGIELAMARRPALILLDINMPGMDGYQVLKVLQAEESLRETPVIALTAMAMPRDVERGLAAGFKGYLTKPIDVEQFLETVNRCLENGVNAQ